MPIATKTASRGYTARAPVRPRRRACGSLPSQPWPPLLLCAGVRCRLFVLERRTKAQQEQLQQQQDLVVLMTQQQREMQAQLREMRDQLEQQRQGTSSTRRQPATSKTTKEAGSSIIDANEKANGGSNSIDDNETANK